MRGLIDRITNRDRIREMEGLIRKKDADLEELGEMTDSLVATVRVLKMRIDTVMPAGQPGAKPDE